MARGEAMPQVAVGAGVFHAEVEGLDGMNNAAVFGLLRVPLTAIWEGAHTVSSHQREADAARSRLAETEELLALEVQRSWDELQAAWGRTAVAELGVEQANESVREATDRRNAGLAPLSELLDARVDLRKAEDARTETRVDYQLERAAFLRAAGR